MMKMKKHARLRYDQLVSVEPSKNMPNWPNPPEMLETNEWLVLETEALNWLVVSTPLKIVLSVGIIIPNIWKKYVPNHQPVKKGH
jgi:hypothetical protein